MLIARGSPPAFPDPRQADSEGLVAIGGDLSAERLLLAYDSGIFPWYDRGLPPLWWSPDPRAVLERKRLHVSRSMRRLIRHPGYRLTFNRDFRRVMVECGRHRDGGTWILPEMVTAYVRLHDLGDAHSFEVWEDGELVGGLYGVQRGGLFAAESMFHRRTNASKLALIASVIALFDAGVVLYDVQFLTPHLESMGATLISRTEYLARLERARGLTVELGPLSALDDAKMLENLFGSTG